MVIGVHLLDGNVKALHKELMFILSGALLGAVCGWQLCNLIFLKTQSLIWSVGIGEAGYLTIYLLFFMMFHKSIISELHNVFCKMTGRQLSTELN